eukprot:g10323.t1
MKNPAGTAVVQFSLDNGETQERREARARAEKMFNSYFYGGSRELETKTLVMADDIAMEVIHKILREDMGDMCIWVEFDGAQGSVVTPAAEASGKVKEGGTLAATRIVDHSSKWLCVFCEVTLIDYHQVAIPCPARIFSFTAANREADEETLSLTESYQYSRATARLLEQIIPCADDDDDSSLLNRMRYFSLASDFGGSSNPGQHYLCDFLGKFILKKVYDAATSTRKRLAGAAYNVQFCEEHPNSTSLCSCIKIFFEHLGMDEQKFLSRQWLEAMALRHARLSFAEDARENTAAWDPRPSRFADPDRENASEEQVDAREVAIYGVLKLYPNENDGRVDRRKKHFDALYNHTGEFASSVAAVLAALLSLLVVLVCPSTSRWGTVGAVARHLTLINFCGLQERITAMGPIHCGKNYFLYKGRNDIGFLNWLIGGVAAPSDRTTYAHQKVEDVGGRGERLEKIRAAVRNTGHVFNSSGESAAIAFGFSIWDLFAVRALTAAILAVLTEDLEDAQQQRTAAAVQKVVQANDLLEQRYSQADYDKREFCETLQKRIVQECADKYVDRVCKVKGEMFLGRGEDELEGRARTRRRVIESSYKAHTLETVTGIPKAQYALDGAMAAKQPYACRLLFAWKAEQTKKMKAEKAAEDAKKTAAKLPPDRADDADALPSTPGIAGQRLSRRSTDASTEYYIDIEKCSSSDELFVSHNVDHLNKYHLDSATIFETIPGLASRRDGVRFHSAFEVPWMPENGVVPEDFDAEGEDGEPKAKKQKASGKPKPDKSAIWSNVQVDLPTAKSATPAGGPGNSCAGESTTGAAAASSAAGTGTSNAAADAGAAAATRGWEADGDLRLRERQRIAKYLEEQSRSSGKLVAGKDYNISAATRIMRCTILIQEYWDIWNQGTGSSTTASIADGTHDPSRNGKAGGADAWAVFLARHFRGPTPASRTAAQVAQAKKVYEEFSREARKECERCNIPAGAIDEFGAICDADVLHLKVVPATRTTRTRDQENLSPAVQVREEDLAVPFSALGPAEGGADQDVPLDEDCAGIAEYLDESIGDVVDPFDLDYGDGQE